MKRFLILIVLLLSAGACYFVGFVVGTGIFIVAGILLELTFWVRLFKREKNKR